MTETDQPLDWRGIPITPGALVIYGAPVGRSIAMVEATCMPTAVITGTDRLHRAYRARRR